MEDVSTLVKMAFIGSVNIILTTLILRKSERAKLVQELGLLTLVNTIMLLMESMVVCGEPEEEYLLRFVD